MNNNTDYYIFKYYDGIIVLQSGRDTFIRLKDYNKKYVFEQGFDDYCQEHHLIGLYN